MSKILKLGFGKFKTKFRIIVLNDNIARTYNVTILILPYLKIRIDPIENLFMYIYIYISFMCLVLYY